MSEMIERVARALCRQRLVRATAKDWTAQMRTAPYDPSRDVDRLWPQCGDDARELIAAMRDPPEHVVCAIEAEAEERYRAAPDMQRWYGEDVWNAGIDEALK